MILQLSCKPPVFFFLKKNYGPSMKLGEYDPLSALIFNTLMKNRGNSHHEKKLKKYTMFYPIKVSNYAYDKYGIKTFSPISIRAINKYVDILFEFTFFMFVMRKIAAGVKQKTAIEEFMLMYDIDDDVYSYDALQKEYYRFETGQKKDIEKYLQKNTCSFVC